jgi:hypothetical protein
MYMTANDTWTNFLTVMTPRAFFDRAIRDVEVAREMTRSRPSHWGADRSTGYSTEVTRQLIRPIHQANAGKITTKKISRGS